MSDFSIYPNAIDGYAQLPIAVDGSTEINAFSVNTLRSAIANIEAELGVLPSSSSFFTVRARLDDFNDELNKLDQELEGLRLRIENLNFKDLGLATLSELNDIISDATLDDTSKTRMPKVHASTHIAGGSDEIIGGNLFIDYSPTNYSVSNEKIEGQLIGVDNQLEDLDVILETAKDNASDVGVQLDRIIALLAEIADAPIPDEPEVVTGPIMK